MQRCKHRRKFCFVVLPLPKKFFDTFWEPLIRLDLKRGFTPKKAHAYKSLVLARLSDGSGWFPAAPSFCAATSEHTTPRHKRVMRPSSRKGSTPYLKSMYGKRIQAAFMPILLYYIISLCRCQHKTNICLYILMRFFVAISLIYTNGYVIIML